MKRNKTNPTRLSMKGRRFSVKFITITIIILLAISLIMGYISKVLKTSDYFRVKEVILRESDVSDLSYLKGKNIFSIDLKSESRDIIEAYSNYKKIRLVRVLPDRIFADFIRRVPVAFIKLYRYFALDEDGVLFYVPGQPEEIKLPVILGLERKIVSPKLGQSYNNKELMLALSIVNEARKNRILKDYRIKRIDVTNIVNTSILVLFPEEERSDDLERKEVRAPEGLEVKFGDDNIKEKISILAGLIIQGRSELANIKYIDLRFREPVIKLKDAK